MYSGGLLQPSTVSGSEVNSLFFSTSLLVFTSANVEAATDVAALSQERMEGTFAMNSLGFHREPRVSGLLIGDFF